MITDNVELLSPSLIGNASPHHIDNDIKIEIIKLTEEQKQTCEHLRNTTIIEAQRRNIALIVELLPIIRQIYQPITAHQNLSSEITLAMTLLTAIAAKSIASQFQGVEPELLISLAIPAAEETRKNSWDETVEDLEALNYYVHREHYGVNTSTPTETTQEILNNFIPSDGSFNSMMLRMYNSPTAILFISRWGTDFGSPATKEAATQSPEIIDLTADDEDMEDIF